MDRRIKRTRTAVFNAMLDLMVEKDTKKITVMELCKRADINKSTFYLHYKSMDECLQACFKAVTDGIVSISKSIIYDEIKENPLPFITKLLDEVELQLDYLIKFKNSNISGPSIKILKDSLFASICENNNIDVNENYREAVIVSCAVASVVDAIILPLPVFKKDELKSILCSILKYNGSF